MILFFLYASFPHRNSTVCLFFLCLCRPCSLLSLWPPALEILDRTGSPPLVTAPWLTAAQLLQGRAAACWWTPPFMTPGWPRPRRSNFSWVYTQTRQRVSELLSFSVNLISTDISVGWTILLRTKITTEVIFSQSISIENYLCLWSFLFFRCIAQS